MIIDSRSLADWQLLTPSSPGSAGSDDEQMNRIIDDVAAGNNSKLSACWWDSFIYNHTSHLICWSYFASLNLSVNLKLKLLNKWGRGTRRKLQTGVTQQHVGSASLQLFGCDAAGDVASPPVVSGSCRETVWTHPLDVFAEGLAEAGAEDLELDVRVGAAVLKVHRPRQTRDVALKGDERVSFW